MLFGMNSCCCGPYNFIKLEASGSPPARAWKGHSRNGGQFTNFFRGDIVRRVIATSGDVISVTGAWNSAGGVSWDEATGLSDGARQFRDVVADGSVYGYVSSTKSIRMLDDAGATQWTTALSDPAASLSAVNLFIAAVTGGVMVAYGGSGSPQPLRLAYFNTSGTQQFDTVIETSSPAVGPVWMEGIGANVVIHYSTRTGATGTTTLVEYDTSGAVGFEYPDDNAYTGGGSGVTYKNGSIYHFINYDDGGGTNVYFSKVSTAGAEQSKVEWTVGVVASFDVDSEDNVYVGQSVFGNANGWIRKYDSSHSLQWQFDDGFPLVVVDNNDIVYSGGANARGL